MANHAEIGDVEAIRYLKARYFRVIDTKQWEEIRLIFTADAFFDIEGILKRDPVTGLILREDVQAMFPGTGRAVVTGLDAVAAFISRALNDVISVHHGHTAEITVDGDHAKAIWAMEDIFFARDEPHRRIRHAYGHYHDTYRRSNGEWRISSQTLTFLHEEWF